MRKLLLILLILGISGCNGSRFSKLENDLYLRGYNTKQIEMIKLLPDEEIKYFLDKHHKNLANIIIDESYDANKYNLYKKYENTILNEDLIYFVSNDYLDEDGELISKLYRDRFFIKDNLDKYLEYKDNFDNVRDLVEYVNVGAYKKWYEEYDDSSLEMPRLVIASKLYCLGDYVPEDLVKVDSEYTNGTAQYLCDEAYEAFKQMYEAALENDISLKIFSAYRSYDSQVKLYDKYLKKDPQGVVDTYSSRPGFSDHQTGYTCDVSANGQVFDAMNGTKESIWVKDNAYKFGFVVRYPEGKDDITGYMWEAWHLRYVGIEAAITIYKNNITFDEYYNYYVK